MTDSSSYPVTEREFLEDNIATVAFHLGQPGARLSVSHDGPGLAVDPGEVLKEISRRLSGVAQAGRDPDWWRWRYMTPNNGWSKWIALNDDEVTSFRDLQYINLDAGKVELQPLYTSSSVPSTLRQCPICARRVASPCETLAIATSCPLTSTMRGSGWRADCPSCVASKFTCDEHYSASSISSTTIQVRHD